MTEFYIQLSTWGTETPNIVDDEAIYQAERGMNYLDANDFDFLCEADCLRDAENYYFDEISKAAFEAIAESNHP